MRIGQTSAVVFSAKLVGAALGFVATFAFARIVGAEVLGIYALVLTVMKWGSFASDLGIGGATTKRISEDETPGAYLAAGAVWVLAVGAAVAVVIVAFRPLLEAYVDGFDRYVAFSVVWALVALLFVRLFYRFPMRVLEGERRVHVAALLDPLKQGSQSFLQILLVLFGYSLLGMLVGYAVGGVVVGLAALYFASVRPARPTRRHFRSLFDYARYSWAGKLKSRVFNDIDILVLGVFVSPAAIGVYTVAWSLATFLKLFSNSIAATLFPEISYSATQDSTAAVRGYIEDSLAFTGLFAVPGFVGAFLLAEDLLSVYGPEFVDGAVVLWVLVFAILLYAYQKQLVTALNGVDRPDLSFRVNAVFAALNVSLNLALVPSYGIEGAAVASVLSVSAALAIAYYYLDACLAFSTPVGEIVRQVVAALCMGVAVLLGRQVLQSAGLFEWRLPAVAALVGFGAGCYFLALVTVSPRFRQTVGRNLPLDGR